LNVYEERWPEAIQDLRAAVKRNPEAFQAYLNLAQALKGGDRPDEALAVVSVLPIWNTKGWSGWASKSRLSVPVN